MEIVATVSVSSGNASHFDCESKRDKRDANDAMLELGGCLSLSCRTFDHFVFKHYSLYPKRCNRIASHVTDANFSSAFSLLFSASWVEYLFLSFAFLFALILMQYFLEVFFFFFCFLFRCSSSAL